MIKINQVSHILNGKSILKDINLTIETGGITALIGPNGAGKSTLFSLISRLQTVQCGNIFLDDMDINNTPSILIAQHLSILTQDNPIYGRINVYDLLMFGRYPHHKGRITDEDKQIVNKAIEDFELKEFSNYFLSQLSGGQRQRVLIAMIFCQQTSHILLDEPLNNLDMYHARELMRLLRRLTDKLNLTIVMVIHDINMAAAYADIIVAMKDGCIVEIGAPKDILTEKNIHRIFSLDVKLLDFQQKKIIIHHI